MLTECDSAAEEARSQLKGVKSVLLFTEALGHEMFGRTKAVVEDRQIRAGWTLPGLSATACHIHSPIPIAMLLVVSWPSESVECLLRSFTWPYETDTIPPRCSSNASRCGTLSYMQ